MMKMDLEQTYKAVLLKRIFEEELAELEKVKQKIILKGTISNDVLLRKASIWMFVLSIIMLVINFLARPDWTTIFYYPLLLGFSVFISTPFLLGIWLYFSLRKKVNAVNKNNEGLANYMLEKEATETNLKTICNALENHSSVPEWYQTKPVLESLIRYIQNGRAKTLDDAIKIYENYIRNVRDGGATARERM